MSLHTTHFLLGQEGLLKLRLPKRGSARTVPRSNVFNTVAQVLLSKKGSSRKLRPSTRKQVRSTASSGVLQPSITPDEPPPTPSRYTFGPFPTKTYHSTVNPPTTQPSQPSIEHLGTLIERPNRSPIDDSDQQSTSASAAAASFISRSYEERLQSAASSSSSTISQSSLTPEQLLQLAEAALGPQSKVWRAGRKQHRHSPLVKEALSNPYKQSASNIAASLAELFNQQDYETGLKLFEKVVTNPEVVDRLDHLWALETLAVCPSSNSKSLNSRLAFQYLRLLPRRLHTTALYIKAFKACASCRDLPTGLEVQKLAELEQISMDTKFYTTFISVCKSVGDADLAFATFQDMQARQMQMDAYVYGAVISAHAEAMTRDSMVAHERKRQLVLLETAFSLVALAERDQIKLPVEVWNSLVTAAGRCGQVSRAFSVLDLMKERKIGPTVRTYGALAEACVEAQLPDRAFRVFELALAKGFTRYVELYTIAISACKLPGNINFDKALEIYNMMQANGVKADKKLFACLIAVAGKAGRLDLAIEMLEEMAAEGLPVTSTICSSLIYACMSQGSLPLARRVYDICRQMGVVPVVSQFNRLMEAYSGQFRFGEVVMLLSDMTSEGLTPNVNTYRILLNACQRCNQPQLAFEVFAIMQTNRLRILSERFAQTIYYTLIKICYNQTRYLWAPPAGYPPSGPPNSHAPPPIQQLREQEAEKVIAALAGRNAKAHKPFLAFRPADSINWTNHALAAYQHMITRGHMPKLSAIDTLLNCLRQKLQHPDRAPASTPSHLHAPEHGRLNAHGRWELNQPAAVGDRGLDNVEWAFEPRAMQVFDQMLNRGFLPRPDMERPVVVDFLNCPPAIAELYVCYIVQTILQRATERGHGHHHSAMTFIVPPFNPDQINWPSYLERLNKRYTAEVSEERLAALASRRQQQQQQSQQSISSSFELPSQKQLEQQELQDMDDEDALVFGGLDAEERSSSSGDEEGGSVRRHELANALCPGADTGEYMADSTTGLAVAATLKRLKLHPVMNWEKGVLILNPETISRWLRMCLTARSKKALRVPRSRPVPNMNVTGASSLAEQQRLIRAGQYNMPATAVGSVSQFSAPSPVGGPQNVGVYAAASASHYTAGPYSMQNGSYSSNSSAPAGSYNHQPGSHTANGSYGNGLPFRRNGAPGSSRHPALASAVSAALTYQTETASMSPGSSSHDGPAHSRSHADGESAQRNSSSSQPASSPSGAASTSSGHTATSQSNASVSSSTPGGSQGQPSTDTPQQSHLQQPSPTPPSPTSPARMPPPQHAAHKLHTLTYPARGGRTITILHRPPPPSHQPHAADSTQELATTGVAATASLKAEPLNATEL